MEFYALDAVLEEISEQIAAHPPELGGALLGPIGRNVISDFIFDSAAKTTVVTYNPSVELARAVQDAELHKQLEFKGIIHSHPGGMNHPSGQDEYELGVGLSLNPHLAYYLVPIVTQNSNAREPNEISIQGGRISFYAAFRDNNNEAPRDMRNSSSPSTKAEKVQRFHGRSASCHLEKITVHKIPILEDIRRLAHHLTQQAKSSVEMASGLTPVAVERREMYSTSLRIGDAKIILLFSEYYPLLSPFILYSGKDGKTRELPLVWNWTTDASDRLFQCADWAEILGFVRDADETAMGAKLMPEIRADVRESLREGLTA